MGVPSTMWRVRAIANGTLWGSTTGVIVMGFRVGTTAHHNQESKELRKFVMPVAFIMFSNLFSLLLATCFGNKFYGVEK